MTNETDTDVVAAELAELAHAAGDETAEHARRRYEKAIALAGPRLNPYYASMFAYAELPHLAPSAVAQMEAVFGTRMPADMRSYYAEHPRFAAGPCKVFTLQQIELEKPSSSGLVQYINDAWGGRPEFEEYYGAAQIQALNEQYTAFGVDLDPKDDNVHHYCYFDRQGKFGVLFFNQDYFDEAQEEYFDPMLEESPADLSFNQLVSARISATIKQMIARLD